MIELSTISATTAGAAASNAATGAATDQFALALNAIIDASAPASSTVVPGVTSRQAPAANGKPLPGDDDAIAATDTGDEDDTIASALVWVPVVPPLPVADVPAATTKTDSTVAPAAVAIPSPPAPPAAMPQRVDDHSASARIANLVATGVSVSPPDTVPPPAIANILVNLPTADATTTAPATPAVQKSDPQISVLPSSQHDDPAGLPVPAAARLLVATAPAAPIQPARQAFAALSRLVTPAIRPLRDDKREGISAVSLPLSDASAISTGHALRAAADAGGAALDLRHDRGLQQMIDHIEILRDDADARDTRIRLVPDALGTVDVAVRKDGDAVAVHFTAQNDATRTLLADAQPRLAALAEARGVRITDASIGGDTGQQGGAHPQPRRESAPVMTATPRRADTAEPIDSADQRLA